MSENVQFWESLLRESSKRTKQSESAVIFIGNSKSGKSSIIKQFCEKDKDSSRDGDEIISYYYFNLSNFDENAQNVESGRVSVWSLDEKSFGDFSDVVMDPTKLDNVVIVVACDLSQDNCFEDVHHWLILIRHKLQTFVTSKKTATNVPIIVLGTKSEYLHADDIDKMKHAKRIQGQLRLLCADANASLLFCSLKSDINCQLVPQHILNGLFPDSFPISNTIQEGTSNVIVPAGTDSVELIAAATDVDTTLTSKEIKRGYADQAISEPPEQVQLGHVVNVESLPTLQDEQEWLLQLKNSLVDAGSVTSSNSAFAAASSTTNSSSNATTSARRASTAELTKSNSYVNPLTAAAYAATVTTKGAPKRSSVAGGVPNTAPAASAPKGDAKDFFKNLLNAPATNTASKK